MGYKFWQLFIEIKYIYVIFAKYLVKLGIPTNCKSHTVISAANRHMLTLTVRPSVRCVPNTHNPMTSQPSRAPNCNCNCKCSVSKCLYYWCDIYVFRYFKIYIYMCIYVYLFIIWVYSWVEGDSTLLIVLMRKSRSYNGANGCENLISIWEEFIKKNRYWIWPIHRLILVRYNNFVYIPIYLDE